MAAKKASSTTPKKAATRKGRSDFGAPIESYFEQLPAEKRVPLDKLRALVEATVPRAESSLKWGAPFYTLDGKMLCALGALKHEVAISFFGPPDAFEDPKGQLQGKGADYRVLKVKDGAAIDTASVKRWLKAAAK
jgi:hypothetical protein